jgi:hypothetical protein
VKKLVLFPLVVLATAAPAHAAAPIATAPAAVASAEGTDGAKKVKVTLTLSAPAPANASVRFKTAAGTAAYDIDFTTRKGTLKLKRGKRSAAINVQVATDALDEANETFTLKLSSPKNIRLKRTATTITLTDDDEPPSASITDVALTEGPNAVAQAQVTLSGPSSRTISVDYATQDGSAISGPSAPDFDPDTGTITFHPGETSKAIPITVYNDPRDEPVQDFRIVLTQGINATLGDPGARVEITDEDGPPGLTINDTAILEVPGSATLTVTPSVVSELPITFKASTSPGSATGGATCAAGIDHVSFSNRTVTIPAGAASGTVDVQICPDGVDEQNESAVVVLNEATNATFDAANGFLVILDND